MKCKNFKKSTNMHTNSFNNPC